MHVHTKPHSSAPHTPMDDHQYIKNPKIYFRDIKPTSFFREAGVGITTEHGDVQTNENDENMRRQRQQSMDIQRQLNNVNSIRNRIFKLFLDGQKEGRYVAIKCTVDRKTSSNRSLLVTVDDVFVFDRNNNNEDDFNSSRSSRSLIRTSLCSTEESLTGLYASVYLGPYQPPQPQREWSSSVVEDSNDHRFAIGDQLLALLVEMDVTTNPRMILSIDNTLLERISPDLEFKLGHWTNEQELLYTKWENANSQRQRVNEMIREDVDIYFSNHALDDMIAALQIDQHASALPSLPGYSQCRNHHYLALRRVQNMDAVDKLDVFQHNNYCSCYIQCCCYRAG